MKAVVYDVPGSLTIKDVEDRALADHEVRLENLAVGMCGSDVHLHHGKNYPAYPLTPGHEIVARVIELGAAVQNLAIGDVVAVDNVQYCGYCERCQEGSFNFCLNRRSMGTKLPGGYAEHAVAPAKNCYQLGNLPIELAVLAEPTACAIHGVGLLGDILTRSVLIAGAGPSALILAQLVRHAGARRVTMAAPTAAKLEVAADLAATETVVVDRGDFAASNTELLAIEPLGYDITIDATGSCAVMEALVPLTKSGGTFMIYGMADPEATMALHPFEIFRRQLTVVGSFAQTYDFGRAIHALQAGLVSSRGMITHRFAIDDYADALAAVRSADCIKAVVEPNGPVLS